MITSTSRKADNIIASSHSKGPKRGRIRRRNAVRNVKLLVGRDFMKHVTQREYGTPKIVNCIHVRITESCSGRCYGNENFFARMSFMQSFLSQFLITVGGAGIGIEERRHTGSSSSSTNCAFAQS